MLDSHFDYEHHLTGGDGKLISRPVPVLPSRWSPWKGVLASFECGVTPDHASLAAPLFAGTRRAVKSFRNCGFLKFDCSA